MIHTSTSLIHLNVKVSNRVKRSRLIAATRVWYLASTSEMVMSLAGRTSGVFTHKDQNLRVNQNTVNKLS